MPHQEKHSKVNAAGEITHVFGHRFLLKTGSKSVLADLTPRGLEVVGLRIGDRVALEGEQKPSEVKVSNLERNGETFAIGHGPHDTREDEADPANSDQNCRGRWISSYWRTASQTKAFCGAGKKGRRI
jgi:hypothetical protein